jgi:hypothetical protein
MNYTGSEKQRMQLDEIMSKIDSNLMIDTDAEILFEFLDNCRLYNDIIQLIIHRPQVIFTFYQNTYVETYYNITNYDWRWILLSQNTRIKLLSICKEYNSGPVCFNLAGIIMCKLFDIRI